MIFSRRRAPQPAPAVMDARVPPGQRVYAIGDIHGRLDLLERLAVKVQRDLSERPCSDAVAVFLGDYIDRGPESAGVLEFLCSGSFPAPMIPLRGNHEAILLDFLNDESVLESWRHYGALETFVSYGVDVKAVLRGRDFAAARDALWSKLPTRHLDFVAKTGLSWSIGDYFFCHAGVRPNVPLARQSERDLMWIRDEFTAYRGPLEKVVVHGHTPSSEPENLPYRINVDTGAYATGVLTCVALEGGERRFIVST